MRHSIFYAQIIVNEVKKNIESPTVIYPKLFRPRRHCCGCRRLRGRSTSYSHSLRVDVIILNFFSKSKRLLERNITYPKVFSIFWKGIIGIGTVEAFWKTKRRVRHEDQFGSAWGTRSIPNNLGAILGGRANGCLRSEDILFLITTCK